MRARFLSIFGLISALVKLMLLHFSDACCAQIYPRELPGFKRMTEDYAKDTEKYSDLFQSVEWMTRINRRTFVIQTNDMRETMLQSLLALVHTFHECGAQTVCFIFSICHLFVCKHFFFSLRTSTRCMKTTM